MTYEQLIYKALVEQDKDYKIMYAVALCEGSFNNKPIKQNIELGKKILFDLGENGDTYATMYYAMTLLNLNLEPVNKIIEYYAPRCKKNTDPNLKNGMDVFLANLYIINNQDELGIKILKNVNLPNSWNILASYYLGHFNELVIPYVKYKERTNFKNIINIDNGKYYLEEAIKNNYPRAYFLKGLCLIKETFGFINDNEAYKLFQLAHSNGVEEAEYYLNNFKKTFFKGWVYKGNR